MPSETTMKSPQTRPEAVPIIGGFQAVNKTTTSETRCETKDTPKRKAETSGRMNFGSGQIINLLDKDLLFNLLTAKIDADTVPPRKPLPPEILTRPTERILVGFTTDNQRVKTRGRGSINKCRASKIVHPTAKRSFNSFDEVEKPITEAYGLHLQAAGGLIVSREQVVFITRFNTQGKREAEADELQERHRVEINAAIPG